MERILDNEGVHFIGLKIFGYLATEDLLKCTLVSRSWNYFINQNKSSLNLNLSVSIQKQFEAIQNLLNCQCLKCEQKFDLEQKILNNIEELLLKAVIKGWPELLRFLLPYAKEERVDLDAPLPTVHQEPFNKRPLLHNLICTDQFNWEIFNMLLFEVKVDINRKDGDGFRASELAISRIPDFDDEVSKDDPALHWHVKAVPLFLQRRDFDYDVYRRGKSSGLGQFYSYYQKIVGIPTRGMYWVHRGCSICRESDQQRAKYEIRFIRIANNFEYLPFHEGVRRENSIDGPDRFPLWYTFQFH